MSNNKQIIKYLDSWLEQNDKTEITAIQAAEILDRAGILKDSTSRPGLPLRKKFRSGEIPHAEQYNGRWFYILKYDSTVLQHKNDNITTLDTQILLSIENFLPVKDLTRNHFPDHPGLYAIRVKDSAMLPKAFRNELVKRNETLLYIGIATKSIKERLWEEELHAQRHGTFFRTIGSTLGFLPPKNSLKKGQCNFRFHHEDNQIIIKWIEDNLLINFIECDKNIDYIEKNIIKEIKPIMNIQNNPQPFGILKELRKTCIDIARS